MATYFVFNVTQQSSHSAAFPGTRIDAQDGVAACKAYAANPTYSCAVGDQLRWIDAGVNYMNFTTVIATPPSAQAVATPPAFPPVGS